MYDHCTEGQRLCALVGAPKQIQPLALGQVLLQLPKVPGLAPRPPPGFRDSHGGWES